MDRKDLGEILVKEAGKVVMEYFGKLNKEKKKSEKDFVLDADYEAEKLIINKITKEFPEDGILSEEADEIKGSSGYRWVVDPLDGTANFKAKIPYFCVSIGVEKDDKLTMGFIYNPNTKDFYFAQKNKGAFLNDKRIKVSSTEHLIKFFVSYSTSNHKNPEVIKLGAKSFEKILDNCRAIRLRGSSILDLCNLANGVFDGLIKVGASYWDYASGCLLVDEAGGEVTDFNGKKWGAETENLLATNNIKHEELLKLLS